MIIDQLWHSDIIMGKTPLDPIVTWHWCSDGDYVAKPKNFGDTIQNQIRTTQNLVGGLEDMSSSQLTNSIIFQRGRLKPPTSNDIKNHYQPLSTIINHYQPVLSTIITIIPYKSPRNPQIEFVNGFV